MSERSVRSHRGPGGRPLALTMIVKDEEAIVERAIRSAARLVDGVVIVDTGSTDRTREVCQEVCLKLGLDCVVARAVWEGFGPARTAALKLAEDLEYDYALMLDADDRIEATWGFEWPDYDMDAFELRVCLGNVRYSRLQVFRLGGWYYEGKVHEHPERTENGAWCYEPIPDIFNSDETDGIRVIASHEGARSKNPNKWLEDAALLEKELETCDPKWRPRNQFYLAQSYRNAGLLLQAIKAYEARGVDIHGWDQERYCAFLEAGRIAKQLGEVGLVYWAAASSVCPDRAEAHYETACYYENLGKLDRARKAISLAASLPKTEGALFLEHDIYDLHIPHTYTRLHAPT